MNQQDQRRSRRFAASALATALIVAWIAVPATAADQRVLERSFPVLASDTLRIANLAGHVEIVQGSGSELRVTATLHADGRNASQLLSGMDWVESQDRKGRDEWALSYPVEEYRSFHYPGSDRDGAEPSFWERLFSSFNMSQTTSHYRGRSVRIVSRPSSSAPTLYADLVVTLPSRGSVAIRNVMGHVDGGSLEGILDIDTGSGAVTLEAFRGKLLVDTGSGTVRIGEAIGETGVDTGSGGIVVDRLTGNADLDTGSGSVRVRNVAAGKLRIDTGSGGITVEDGTVGTLLADTGSGSIRVNDVEFETFEGDTGSGGVSVVSSLADARSIDIDTGSGSVKILGGPNASFDLSARQGSGSLRVLYDDAQLKKRGYKVVGAERLGGQTRIVVETGSGSCTIGPR